jgi:hypothetical protein
MSRRLAHPKCSALSGNSETDQHAIRPLSQALEDIFKIPANPPGCVAREVVLTVYAAWIESAGSVPVSW